MESNLQRLILESIVMHSDNADVINLQLNIIIYNVQNIEIDLVGLPKTLYNLLICREKVKFILGVNLYKNYVNHK
jgi:hypothetical protein